MPPVTYDENRSYGRQNYLYTITTLATLFVLVCLAVLFGNFERAAVSWLELSFAGLIAAAALWVHAGHVGWLGLNKRFRARLTADEQGLTWANGLSTRRWAWSELSPFEYVAPGRWVGAYIRFRPNAIRWTAIQDMHPTAHGWEFRLTDTFDTPLPEIAVRLNALRGHTVR